MMPTNVQCPNCPLTLSVPREMSGKVTKCPRCKLPFEVAFSSYNQSVQKRESGKDGILKKEVLDGDGATLWSFDSIREQFPGWAKFAVPALATLCLGYFAGSEHLIHQTQNVVSKIGVAISDGLASEESGERDGDVGPPLLEVPRDLSNARNDVEQVRPNTVRSHEMTAVDDLREMRLTDHGANVAFQLQVDEGNRNERDRAVSSLGADIQFRDNVHNVSHRINFDIDTKRDLSMVRHNPLSHSASVDPMPTTLPELEPLTLSFRLDSVLGRGQVELQIPRTGPRE